MIHIVRERRARRTYWAIEITGGELLSSDIDDFIADLRTAVSTVDQLNHQAKNRTGSAL